MSFINKPPKFPPLDIWSTYMAQIALTTVAGDLALPNLTIAGIPPNMVIAVAKMLMKPRTIENTNAIANSISGAQNIQCQKAVAGAYITGIALAGGEFAVPGLTRESGDVLMGTADIKAQVPANGAVMNFKWALGLASQNSLDFNDLQVGLRIWFL
jgi:hypothetical protein